MVFKAKPTFKLVEAGQRAAGALLHSHKADGSIGAALEDGGTGLGSGLRTPTCNYVQVIPFSYC